MFKIRALNITDLTRLEQNFIDNQQICHLLKNKLLCLLQRIIPHNFRRIPSIHIAVDEKNILGFAILRCASRPNNCWQIDEVFVINEMRNKGVGEELVRYVLSVYGSYGIEHFLAEVDSENFPALSLFHQCGFRRYAKVSFYKKEIIVGTIHELPLLDNKDFSLRIQTHTDLPELEKIALSSIPPDLRSALGRSKEYFKDKKNAFVLVEKSRNLVIGWAQSERQNENHFIEILISPGWTHLYEGFLNTIICDYISLENNPFTVTVKASDYLTELTETLGKLSYLPSEVKELLVRTIWQKAKEKKKKTAKVGVPSIAPT